MLSATRKTTLIRVRSITWLALGAAVACIAACGGGSSSSSSSSSGVLVSHSVTSSGGTAAVTDPSSPLANTSITIPSGALKSATTITIAQVTSGTGLSSDVLVADIGPTGTTFATPATVTIDYSSAYLTDINLLPADADTTHLKVVAMDPGVANETLPTTSVDATNHTVSAKTTHLSDFAVLGYTDATLDGTYGAVTYTYDNGDVSSQPATSAQGHPQAPPLGFETTNGTATFDGKGSFTFTGTKNVNGTAGSSSASGTYTVNSDGSFSMSGGDGFSVTGHVLAGSSVAIFSENPAGSSPKIYVAVKSGASGYTAASLDGSYGTVTYAYDSSAVSTQPNANATGQPQAIPLGFTTTNGTATFDGKGNFTFSGTKDVDGSGKSTSASGTYTVNPDGSFSMSAGSDFSTTGSLLQGGSMAVFTQNSGAVPQIYVGVKTGASGLSDATLNGTYGAVTYSYDSSAVAKQPATTAVGQPQAPPLGFATTNGTVTFDGKGNFTFSGTKNVDGTAGSDSASGTYAVSPDGSFTMSGADGFSITGYVVADGSVAVFSQNPGGGAPPQIYIAIAQ